MNVPISARVQERHYMYSIAPDVCLTPMGSSMVPVGYNSICFLRSSSRMSRTVFNNSHYDWQLNTRCTRTQGHEPGTGKGVKVPGYMAISHIMEAEPTIFSEGFAIVRTDHIAWMNRPDEGPVETKRTSTKRTVKHV